MIRNIVFDLGNVLISFRPGEYLARKNYPENIRNIILADIFNSPEWLMLDRGTITVAEAVNSIAGRSMLKKEEISRIFGIRTEIMFPLENNVKLLPELKKRGFCLYFLSNFPADIFDEVRNRFSFFGYFSGGMISAEVRFLKPEPEIFGIFFERFGLVPHETLFIDDHQPNIETASQLGMKILHTGGSTEIEESLSSVLGDFLD